MNILAVQKGSDFRQFVETSLEELDHKVYLAENGLEAWDMLGSESIDMVIADWNLAEMDGPALCRRIKDAEFEESVYIILVTEHGSEDQIVEGLEAGCDDTISDPIRFQELRARIELGARILKSEREAGAREDDLKKSYIQTISMFTSLIEVFHEDLGGHCRRTGQLCLELARRHPNVKDKDYEMVEIAGYLHDIGMIGLPNDILSKKRTERNDDERKAYLSHPARGEIILNEIEVLKPISNLVRSHHEQFNGRGFPDGLEGDRIPVLSMIVSAASIYDNFLHRGNVSMEEIPKDLQRMSGYQLDPKMVDLLLEINLNNIHEEDASDYMEVAIGDLQEGMVLARDIRMKTGALAMPRETRMTAHGVEKLNHYFKLECIGNRVYVKKPG